MRVHHQTQSCRKRNCRDQEKWISKKHKGYAQGCCSRSEYLLFGHRVSSPLCPQLPSAYSALGPRAELSLLLPGQQGQDSQHRAMVKSGWGGEVLPKIGKERGKIYNRDSFLEVDNNFVSMSSRMHTGCGKQEDMDIYFP